MSERSTEAAAPRLTSLELEPGNIQFDPEITDYRITVAPDVTKILVKPSADSGDATYLVNGNSGLKPGENLITVTVNGKDGSSTVYRISVQVGETAAEETLSAAAGGEEKSRTAETQAVSLPSFAMKGPMKAVTFGIGFCLIAAAVLWAVFAVRRHMEKRAEEIRKQERRIARERQKERQQLAMRQEEELLRQIEILTEKSKSAKLTESPTGLRIIELSEEEAQAAHRSAEEEYPDLTEDLLDDFFDDDDDFDDDVADTAGDGGLEDAVSPAGTDSGESADPAGDPVTGEGESGPDRPESRDPE